MRFSTTFTFLQVEDLSPTGRLYPQRFVTAPSSSTSTEDDDDDGGFLSFRLTKHQLPDTELSRRAEDAHLHLRLGPAYYVHTQDFLTTAIATLDRFLQYQDLMNRVRASSEGYKVRRELQACTRTSPCHSIHIWAYINKPLTTSLFFR